MGGSERLLEWFTRWPGGKILVNANRQHSGGGLNAALKAPQRQSRRKLFCLEKFTEPKTIRAGFPINLHSQWTIMFDNTIEGSDNRKLVL